MSNESNWARRPKSDEPVAEQRELRDDNGRRWIGSVMSGRFEGGEEHAEVLFVCTDQPSELKRVSELGVAPGEAGDLWCGASVEEVEGVFRRSRPA